MFPCQTPSTLVEDRSTSETLILAYCIKIIFINIIKCVLALQTKYLRTMLNYGIH